MKKAYVIKDLNDPTKLKVEYRNKPPIGGIPAPIDPLTGLPEEGTWLQLEDIERPSEPGVYDRVVTVNETLKNNILGQRAADKLANELEDENKLNEIKSLKATLKNLKKADLTNAESIKQAIVNINDFLIKLDEGFLNIDSKQKVKIK